MEKIFNLTATEIGAAIAEEKVCPIELTQGYIEKIKSHPDSGSIFTSVMEESALSQAKAARKRIQNGIRLSALDGVPISWKDLFDTLGLATESGSALLQGRIPNQNALVIENASASGIISLAKTHMTELAFSGLGVNPKTKTPPNSVNKRLAPGGSSSGAAVSVAGNLVSGSIGSDTGGSVRVPAAWNNLVGLKTTYNLVSLDGVVPLCPKFDTVGPIVKSVEDANNLLSVLLKKKSTALSDIKLENKCMAVIETTLLEKVDDGIKLCFEQTIEKLIKSGIKIVRIKSNVISDAMELSSTIFSPEAYGTWKDVIEKNPEKMHVPVLERFRSGADIDAPTYVRAWQNLEILRKKYIKLIEQFHVTLAPTTPIFPPETSKLLASNEYFSERNLLTLRNTRLANLMGLPALTIPTNTDFCGFMIMGKPFEETALLEVGKAIEGVLKLNLQ